LQISLFGILSSDYSDAGNINQQKHQPAKKTLFQISIEHHQSTNQINQISQQPVSYPAGCAAVCSCLVVGWYNFHYGALAGSDCPFCSAEISEMTDTMGGFACTKWNVLHALNGMFLFDDGEGSRRASSPNMFFFLGLVKCEIFCPEWVRHIFSPGTNYGLVELLFNGKITGHDVFFGVSWSAG